MPHGNSAERGVARQDRHRQPDDANQRCCNAAPKHACRWPPLPLLNPARPGRCTQESTEPPAMATSGRQSSCRSEHWQSLGRRAERTRRSCWFSRRSSRRYCRTRCCGCHRGRRLARKAEWNGAEVSIASATIRVLWFRSSDDRPRNVAMLSAPLRLRVPIHRFAFNHRQQTRPARAR